MKISTKSQYGLRALLYLTAFNAPLSLKIISKEEKIPFDYLEKIMIRLKKAGILKSKKGAHGGYFLARNPNKITIGEIVRTLEEDISPVNCLKEGRTRYHCIQEKKCVAKKAWKKIKDSFDLTLDSMKLADLIHK